MTDVDLHALIRRMAAAALNEQVDTAQKRTRRLVPKDTRALEESIFSEHASPDDLTAQIGTNSPYAIFVHEDLHDRHDDGQVKYMESAVVGGDSARQMQAAAERGAKRVAQG